jgi:hemolysin D
MTAQTLSRRAVAVVAQDFQGPLDQLVQEPAPRGLLAWPYLATAFLAALCTIAAVAPIDVTVIATGRIATDAPAVVLKPMMRAVLTDLLVKPGDPVRKGQVLARLDASLALADQAALRAEATALAAEINRREADVSGQTTGLDEGSQGIPALRSAEILAERTALDRAIAGLTALRAIETGLIRDLEDQLRIAGDIETMRHDLARRKSGTELDAKSATSARLGAEVALSAALARRANLDREIAALADQSAMNSARRKREAAEALAALRLRADQVGEALQKAATITDLAILRASRDGVVVSIAPGGKGAVMTENEAIVAVVPSDAQLLAEVTIDGASLGKIAVGDPVRIKIDAFPWRRHGEVRGMIESIAPLSFDPEKGGAAQHPLRIVLTALPAQLTGQNVLIPGMTLTADIEIGTRSVLDFFLDPLARGLSESLREP